MLSYPNYLLSEYCYLMIILDPKYYYHARNDPRWQVAMDEEMNYFQKNTTWELSSFGKEIGSMQVGVSDEGFC